MLRRRVSAKRITTTDKEVKNRGRQLLPNASVKTCKFHTTSGIDRENRLSKNSRILGANQANLLWDVGKPDKHQENSHECIFFTGKTEDFSLHSEKALEAFSSTSSGTNSIGITPRLVDRCTTSNDYLESKVTTEEMKSVLHQNQSFEKTLTRSSITRKPMKPSRLFSIAIHKDLGSTKRKNAFYYEQNKKFRRCSKTGLLTREDMSKTNSRKLSKSENQICLISNLKLSDKSYEDSKLSDEEGVYSQVFNNYNLNETKTAPEIFSPRSSSQYEVPFVFSSPPPSQIVTLAQIRAKPPGAPRAVLKQEINSFVPSPLYRITHANQSSSELDDTSMEKEPSNNDRISFSFDLAE